MIGYVLLKPLALERP